MKNRLIAFFEFICIIYILVSCSSMDKGNITGRYLKTNNDAKHIIIDKSNSPIVMTNRTEKENFCDDLKTGDKIEITCDEVKETYPGMTTVYDYKLIEKGSLDDIATDILSRLEGLGYKFNSSELDK